MKSQKEAHYGYNYLYLHLIGTPIFRNLFKVLVARLALKWLVLAMENAHELHPHEHVKMAGSAQHDSYGRHH